jgi:PAP2 superfamily
MRKMLRFAIAAALLGLGLRGAHADYVTKWNQIAVDATNTAGISGNIATRDLAIVEIAVNDATVPITHYNAPYHAQLTTNGPASAEAAAVQAAHDTLAALFPSQQATFDSQLKTDLAAINADVTSRANGVTLGKAAAADILSLRANDGSAPNPLPPPYLGSTDPGKWRPTPPNFTPGAKPYLANVTLFALTSPSQFRPGPPPALDSAAYKAAYDEVKSLGRVDSTTRTVDQTQIAEFWVQETHIVTNEIARTVATQQGFSLAQNARLFALLNIAVADAIIAGWDAKYFYSTWRPITAINLGSYNPDPNWTPLLSLTPSHPEYVSTHSTQGAAAFTILRDIFGDKVGFSADSPTLPGVTRTFTSFTQAELENGRSRIYGGIHFQFSNEAGQVAGESVGNYVVGRKLRRRQ